MALFGWENAVDAAGAALAATAAADGLGVDLLRVPVGSPAVAWQTPAGTTAAGLTIAAPAALSWRVACLSRTNLTSAATMRVRLGDATVWDEAAPAFATAPAVPGWVSPFTVTRAHTPSTASATFFDDAGALVEVGQNAARVTHDPATLTRLGLLLEPARTNGVRNPRCEGGTNGTPGAPPTFWSGFSSFAGLTVERLGTGVANGIPYVRYRFSGTSNSNSAARWNLEAGGSGIAATVGLNVTHSQYVRTVAGSMGALNYSLEVREYAGVTSGALNGGVVAAASGAWTRFWHTRTLTDAGTTNCVPALRVALPSGQSIDWTFDIGAPQIEVGNFPTSNILPPVGSPQQATRGAEAVTAALPANAGTLNLYAETNVIAATTAAVEAFSLRARLTGDDNNAIRLRLFGGSPAVVDIHAVQGGAAVRDGASATVTPGAIRRDVMGLTPAAFAHWAGGAAIGTLAGLSLAPAQLAMSSGEAVVLIRDVRVYGALTEAQALALSAAGSTLTPAVYDSGVVPAGVAVGVGQALHILPAALSAPALRIDLADPTNPDGFLNVPLVFAGPAAEAALAPDSDMGLDVRMGDTTTRAGVVFADPLSRARGWSFRLVAKRDEDLAWLDAFEAAAAARRNVLFVPRAEFARAASEAVFGLCMPGRRSFATAAGQRRRWSATISERL